MSRIINHSNLLYNYFLKTLAPRRIFTNLRDIFWKDEQNQIPPTSDMFNRPLVAPRPFVFATKFMQEIPEMGFKSYFRQRLV